MNAIPESFPACAAGPDRNAGDLAGTLRLTQFSLFFEAEQITLEFPLSNLQINADPLDTDRILFTHTDYPGWELATYSKEILLHRNLANRADLKRKLEQLRTEVMGPPAHAVKVYGFIAAIFLLVLAFWMGNNVIIGAIVQAVPNSWEASLGEDVLKEVKEEYEMTQDPVATNFVFAIGQRLVSKAPQSGVRYRFHVSSDGLINAFALPGGHVVVFQGLIDLVETPEELAGVMAHEIAHVVQRHTLRKSAEAAGPMLAVKYLFGEKNAVLGALAATSSFIGSQRYSRIYEHEADDLAIDYLVKAEINPQGLVDFFSKIQKREGRSFGALSVFDSHPPTAERIERLQAKISALPSKKYKPFPALKKPKATENPIDRFPF